VNLFFYTIHLFFNLMHTKFWPLNFTVNMQEKLFYGKLCEYILYARQHKGRAVQSYQPVKRRLLIYKEYMIIHSVVPMPDSYKLVAINFIGLGYTVF
jgi:hypothetical protein